MYAKKSLISLHTFLVVLVVRLANVWAASGTFL